MQRCLDPEKGVNKPFENVFMSGAYSKFFQGGGTNFRHFSSVVFSTNLILSNLSTKNVSMEGPGAYSPGKFLKICTLQWPF